MKELFRIYVNFKGDPIDSWWALSEVFQNLGDAMDHIYYDLEMQFPTNTYKIEKE